MKEEWSKEIKSIPFGLSNMFHKHKNYLAEEIEYFIKNVIKLQNYEVAVEGGLTKNNFTEYLQNFNPTEKK